MEAGDEIAVDDATAGMLIVILLFVLPAKGDFLARINRRETSPPLVTWKILEEKMNWGLVLLLGGGFALAKATNVSGLSAAIAEFLVLLDAFPKYGIVAIVCLICAVLTEFTSNVATANVLLPVLRDLV